jgi:hypothetical protein
MLLNPMLIVIVYQRLWRFVRIIRERSRDEFLQKRILPCPSFPDTVSKVIIAHGRADILVAEQFLDFPQILSHVVEQDCGRGMPEPIRPSAFGFPMAAECWASGLAQNGGVLKAKSIP